MNSSHELAENKPELVRAFKINVIKWLFGKRLVGQKSSPTGKGEKPQTDSYCTLAASLENTGVEGQRVLRLVPEIRFSYVLSNRILQKDFSCTSEK